MPADNRHAPDNAVRVTDLSAALLAAEVAQSVNRPLILVSEPEAGIYAGGGWWRALTDHVARAHPGLSVTAILDCGAHVGAALGAIRAGCSDLTLTQPSRAMIGFATAWNVTLHERPARVLTLGPLDARTGSVIQRFLLDER